MFALDVYKDPKAPALALLFITLKKYGYEILDFESELVRDVIEKDYNIALTDLQMDKLSAAVIVFSTNIYEDDWRVFETVNHTFCNHPVDYEDLNPLEAEELTIGLAHALLIKQSLIDPEDEESLTVSFTDEVRAYAGQIFYDYGFHYAPALLPTAILPKTVGGDDTNKNEALNELFHAVGTSILEYLEKINL